VHIFNHHLKYINYGGIIFRIILFFLIRFDIKYKNFAYLPTFVVFYTSVLPNTNLPIILYLLLSTNNYIQIEKTV